MALGLSATPVREFDDGFERYIEPALGPVVYEYDYARARSEGVISPFDLHNFHFDLTTSEDCTVQPPFSPLAAPRRG